MTSTPDASRPTSCRRGLFLARCPGWHRRGLSLAETIIVGIAITGVAVGLVVIGKSVQSVDAEGRTRSILARLTAATRAYADDLGAPAWPSADAALRSMRRHGPSGQMLAGVPIRVEPGRGLTAIDGYGRPMRFDSATPNDPRGTGHFVSAGADGLFGDEPHHRDDPASAQRAESDNHYGAELATLAPMYPEAAASENQEVQVDDNAAEPNPDDPPRAAP